MFDLSGVQLGSYLIIARIAHGGMSTIFEAVRTENGAASDQAESVAIKVLSAAMGLDPGFKVRFDREIDVLRGLEHPNIVPILDAGESAGMTYIVMPYYRGGTLAERLTHGALTLDEGGQVIDQVARALQFAHDRGVVHRDVKPSNMLLDADGSYVLSDFGFAHLTDTSLSLTGSSIIGTPAYMSPEQCAGEQVDGRSDQYSLAIVAYQLFTGQPPFASTSAMSVVVKHMHDPVPLPKQLNPDLPQSLQEVLLKALSKKPERRFANVLEFNQALQSSILKALDPAQESRWHERLVYAGRDLLRKLGAGADLGEQARQRRRLGLGLAAVTALLLIALTAMGSYAMRVRSLANRAPEVQLVMATPADLVMTIEALNRRLAQAAGGTLSPTEVSALVGTLTALAPSETVEAFGSPTPSGTGMPTSAPTEIVILPPPSGRATATPSIPPLTTTATQPTPSFTPLPPTATSVPSLTSTALPALHVGALSGSSEWEKGKWSATVIVTVHNAVHQGISGVVVRARWSTGKTELCQTSSGSCPLTIKTMNADDPEVSLTVQSLTLTGWQYQPAANDSPLGSSPSLTILRPSPPPP